MDFFEGGEISLEFIDFILLILHNPFMALVFWGKLFDFGEKFVFVSLEGSVLEWDGLIFFHSLELEGNNTLLVGLDARLILLGESWAQLLESFLKMLIKLDIIHVYII